MKALRSRWFVLASMLTSGAVVYQIGTAGCAQFAGTHALQSVDFCWIFDCSGFGGGLIDPCGDPTTALDDILADCSPPTGTDTGTGTGTTTGTTTTGTTTTGTGTTTTGFGGF